MFLKIFNLLSQTCTLLKWAECGQIDILPNFIDLLTHIGIHPSARHRSTLRKSFGDYASDLGTSQDFEEFNSLFPTFISSRCLHVID